MSPHDPPDASEQRRLNVVRRLRVHETLGERTFDDLMDLAVAATGAPVAALSFLDEDHHWFKASVGLDIDRLARSEGIFDPAKGEGHEIAVPDLMADGRFGSHPLVVGHPFARSYLGVPVHTSGEHVGTLSVMDVRPRRVQAKEVALLRTIARHVNRLLELRWRRTIDTPPHQDYVDKLARTLVSIADFNQTIESELRPAWLYDTRTLRFLAVNEAATQKYGWSTAQFLGMRLTDIRPRAEANLLEAVVDMDGFQFSNGRSWCHRRSDGTTFNARVVSTAAPAIGDTVRLVVATDMTSRLHAELTLKHAATHDPLTGLANRTLFFDRLSLAMNAPDGPPPSVLYLDLDDFKQVNDSAGHASGDAVLAATAARLAGAVRESDLVARLGGDEFAVICPATDANTAIHIADRIASALAKPLSIAERTYATHASIGIATAHEGSTPESLLGDADDASIEGKSIGPGQVTLFGDGLRARVARRTKITHELRTAIDEGQLVLRYQPIVARDGRSVSFEALARWNHPLEGMLGPDQFIQVAEESGLIQPLGLWVAREASRFSCRLAQLGHRSRVSFNLSARQFSNSLVEDLFGAIDEGGAHPDTLIIELTESVFATQWLTKSIVETMRSRGIAVSLDDFGTGYSSLGRLTSLKIDAVKIDRSFVAHLPGGGANPVLEPMVRLARAIGAQVVAEGVETVQELRTVLDLGCDYIQGFLFARPLDEDSALAFLESDEHVALLAGGGTDFDARPAARRS